MGRHRRSAAGRAATGRATGVTHTDGSYTEGHDPLDSYGNDRPTMGIAPYLNPEAYAEAYAKSDAYLFASDDDYDRITGTTTFPDDSPPVGGSSATAVFHSDGFTPSAGSRLPGGGSHRRRKKKAVAPVKTGLLGVSAAVALGTVAVATGVVPGIDNYQLGGGNGADKVQAADTPTNAPIEQGGTSGSADSQDNGSSTSRDVERPTSPAPSTSSAAPTKTPSKKPSATPSQKPKETPSRTATKAPQKEKEPEREKTSAPVEMSAQAAAAAEVLQLVNQERAQVGCSAVAANSSLTELAQDFSEDMAARGFFDHTDPSGASPWDRAAKAGITDLGGENIARGQADAAAAMEAWMNSPGHKANILNCDFKTLGVGVHFGAGGPWWTQDFGY